MLHPRVWHSDPHSTPPPRSPSVLAPPMPDPQSPLLPVPPAPSACCPPVLVPQCPAPRLPQHTVLPIRAPHSTPFPVTLRPKPGVPISPSAPVLAALPVPPSPRRRYLRGCTLQEPAAGGSSRQQHNPIARGRGGQRCPPRERPSMLRSAPLGSARLDGAPGAALRARGGAKGKGWRMEGEEEGTPPPLPNTHTHPAAFRLGGRAMWGGGSWGVGGQNGNGSGGIWLGGT